MRNLQPKKSPRDQTMISYVVISSILSMIETQAFLPVARPSFGHHIIEMQTPLRNSHHDEEETCDDWRAFRANLVMGERDGDHTKATTTWTYEQPVLERGSLLVHHPRSENSHYGLTDQLQFLYRSVVMIVELNPQVTVGLVLNRPTNIALPDDFLNVPIMYGGNQFGIHNAHQSQKLYFLHRLKNNEDHDCILPGLYLTSPLEAKCMVDQGIVNNKDDLLAFCGFVTWNTMKLVGEMDTGEWHIVSVDPSTLYQEVLSIQQKDHDDRDVVWSTFMNRIDHNVDDGETSNSFDDRMLHEWMRIKLSNLHFPEKLSPRAPLESGMMLRASPDTYILDHQGFHESLLLLLQVDDDFAVGVLLNHPTVDSTDNHLGNIPIRYGGHYDMVDTEEEMAPLCLTMLGELGYGSERVGQSFWRSNLDQAEDAIVRQTRQQHDFIVLRGLEIWDSEDGSNQLLDDYQDGKWDVVESEHLPQVWDMLRSQHALSPLTMDSNIDISHHAWLLAGGININEKENTVAATAELGRDAVKVWVTTTLMDDSEMTP